MGEDTGVDPRIEPLDQGLHYSERLLFIRVLSKIQRSQSRQESITKIESLELDLVLDATWISNDCDDFKKLFCLWKISKAIR